MHLGALADRIDSARKDEDKWCTPEKAHALAAFVVALRPELVVEIGVWRGASAIPLLLALKAAGRGRAIAIDPWDPAASIVGEEPANVEWWGTEVGAHGHEDAYREFLRRLTRNEVYHLCDVRRQTSDSVDPPPGIGLLHVDGNHTEQAVRDVTRFAPSVLPGGILVLDDISWSSGSVGRAHALALEMGFIDLYPVGSGIAMQRVRGERP